MLGWISDHLLHLILPQVQVQLCTDGSPLLVPMTASSSKHLMLSAAAYLPACLACLACPRLEKRARSWPPGRGNQRLSGQFLGEAALPPSSPESNDGDLASAAGTSYCIAKEAPAKMREVMFMKYKVMKVDPVSSVLFAYFCLT